VLHENWSCRLSAFVYRLQRDNIYSIVQFIITSWLIKVEFFDYFLFCLLVLLGDIQQNSERKKCMRLFRGKGQNIFVLHNGGKIRWHTENQFPELPMSIVKFLHSFL
jgi:hypothetical protein